MSEKNIVLSKTDYLLYRDCHKNLWYKFHKPEIYDTADLSAFEKQIIETGNEVELVARGLFPSGFLIEGRGEEAEEKTQELIENQEAVIFQPVFVRDGFLAAVDILIAREKSAPQTNADFTQTNADKKLEYDIYEVKSTTDVDKKTHYHDLAFQINLLEKFGLKIDKSFVIHLNSEYVRAGEVDINQLFKITEVTEEVENIKEAVSQEMEVALKYIAQEEEPSGYCDCVYKGRSNHCSTFSYSNEKVPAYGVHDITRIGLSKTKLQDMVDVGIFELSQVPEDVFDTLTPAQQNQIETHLTGRLLTDKFNIKKELDSLVFPLYFLDYETFPSAIPRFDGFSPYQQIPFQYSLYVLPEPDSTESELKHFEFLFSGATDPSAEFLKSLQENIGEKGSIIVWNKGFECKINTELAKRNPGFKLFIDLANARVYDLMEIFSKQFYVDKNFKGRVSIKNVLPVLVPELSYKNLAIHEGGTASQKWNEINLGKISEAEKQTIIKNLKEYCKLDTFAMYAIWKVLIGII